MNTAAACHFLPAGPARLHLAGLHRPDRKLGPVLISCVVPSEQEQAMKMKRRRKYRE